MAESRIDGRMFLGLYTQVFDDDGNVRNCGRQKTMELIAAADIAEPGVRHGDTRGFLDVPAVKALHSRLQKEM